MSEEEKFDFYDWYKQNELHLRNYTYQELLTLAYFVGFNVGDSARFIIRWIERTRNLQRLWDNPVLLEKWTRVRMFERTGESDD